MPKAVPRSLPVKAAAMRASEVANMMAPPTPWAARARLSMREEVDRPQISEATEKTPSPMANTSRRPNMSPITPAVSRKAARVSE
jgi:hypothetical protein